MPHEPEVTDADGKPLQTGDTVGSLRRFDPSQRHVGVITEINGTAITVRHRPRCCEPGRCSETDASLWKRLRLYKRPTAWEKLLKDDSEMDDSS